MLKSDCIGIILCLSLLKSLFSKKKRLLKSYFDFSSTYLSTNANILSLKLYKSETCLDNTCYLQIRYYSISFGHE